MKELEDGTTAAIGWDKMQSVASTGQAVVPVVLQDVTSGDVLFVGYANDEALTATLTEGIAVLWSTSRNELWRKGASSGDVLTVVDVRINCEQNSLLYRVNRTTAGACHVRDESGQTRPSCYYRTLTTPTELSFVD